MHATTSASCPTKFTPGAHSQRGWVGSRGGLNALEKGKISYPYRESNTGSSNPQTIHYTAYAIRNSSRFIEQESFWHNPAHIMDKGLAFLLLRASGVCLNTVSALQVSPRTFCDAASDTCMYIHGTEGELMCRVRHDVDYLDACKYVCYFHGNICIIYCPE